MRSVIKVQRGEFKGRKLQSPRGADIRPMGARLRCKMVDALRDVLPDALVYDICCGSGAQGIEALSVGARRVAFVDLSHQALKLARGNVSQCGEDALERAEFKRRAADRALEDIAIDDSIADEPLIIFVSPPYPSAQLICSAACRTFAAMAAAGRTRLVLVLQHSPRVQFELPSLADGIDIDRRTYVTGDSQATIFRCGL